MNRVFITLFGFINFFILIRVLPREDFGAWVLFTSIASLMELVKHGFVRNPLIRYLATSSDQESSSIQTASLWLNFIVGILEVGALLLASVFLSSFWDAPQLRPLFLIYIISTLLLVPTNHFDIIQQARMQFKGMFLSNQVRHGGLLLFVLVVFASGMTFELEGLAYAQAAAILLSSVVSFIYAKPFLQLSPNIDWKWFRELRSYGFFTFGTNVSSMINKSIDSWMLGKLISPAAVAVFNPAIRISNLVEVPADTLTSILFPKLAERVAKEGPDAGRYLYEKAVGTITAFMFPIVIFFIVFADPVVRFVAGPGFEQAVPILRLTMLYGLLIPFNRLMGVTLDATGRAKLNFLFVMRNATFNIISNYFFISHYGIIGAAYGTLTTYILVTVINQIYLHNVFSVRVHRLARHFIESYAKVFSGGVRFFRGAL